jgi:hypothetical protein
MLRSGSTASNNRSRTKKDVRKTKIGVVKDDKADIFVEWRDNVSRMTIWYRKREFGSRLPCQSQ